MSMTLKSLPLVAAALALSACTYNTAMPYRTGSGAVISGTIGANSAIQEAELNQRLAGTGARVTNTGSQLRVIFPEEVAFVAGSSSVAPGIRNGLNEVARSLAKHPNSTVRVVGHTDDSGSEAYAKQMTQERAVSVARLLIIDGVASSRITASGRGFGEPITVNSTATGRAQNRRVEVVITPTN